jgi:putative redox protein
MSITVTRDHQQVMSHTVRIRAHTFTTDLSASQGGSDTGPDPHDLYDAALASCKALTMLWYAQRKNMALQDIEVRTERDDSQERQGVYCLNSVLHLRGDLSDAQKRELLSVADKCPVHKLIAQVKTEIHTELAPD